MKSARTPRPTNVAAIVGGKSHFLVEKWGTGFAIIIKRRAQATETILAATMGEVNRIRMEISQQGLIGVNGDAV